ncbi:phage tail protein [Pseudomonas juntendi]|uniref:phage tail protein n=1 Tax=Pseudomonas juntendi TaxID=2666183 RepID=UPI00244CCBB3|nr:phage tail protein [Pseudomonas juntendi]MDG9917848.1 phage tail protein [Pseudomonas juntendi]MDH0506315.1 phage tail protein [Pseudomonas juntendi]MDH1044563.1 phage tail protein [Pseudomonas juntendi]
MVLAAYFVIMLIMMVVAMRMAKTPDNAKAAGIEDFSFPTAVERPVQVLYGTRKLGGSNVLWYGDLSTKAIKQKVKTGFSSKKVTVGYKYYMGVQLGICHGPDVTLKQVWFDDDVAWDGEIKNGSFEINKPELFGGEEKNGGVSGKASFYNGDLAQSANAYLQRVVGVDIVSPLRSLCHAVLEGFYIGNSETPAKISFVCSRFPKSPAGNTGLEIVGDDANPAYVIYEFLTDQRFGASISKSLVDIATFESVAQALFDEGYGVSGVVDSSKAASEIVDDLLKIINGNLVTDAATGTLKLKIVRDDYDIATLPVVDASNIKNLSNFNRGSLDTAVNEVKIKYLSTADGFTERTATAQNLGLRIHKGENDGVSYDTPSVSTAVLAAKIAQREMRPLSVPLATCVVECNRSMFDAEMCDVVLLSWPPLKIEKMVMRIMGVDLGSLEDSTIKLSLTQDVFGVTNTVYSDGTDKVWVKPTFEPVTPPSLEIVEAPSIFASAAGMTRSLLVLAAQPSAGQQYKLVTRQDGEGWADHGDAAFTPIYELVDAMSAGVWAMADGPVIRGNVDELDTYSVGENRQGLGIMWIDGEWLSYESTIQLTSTTCQLKSIRRGLFGTTPTEHQPGQRIWAVSEGHGITNGQFATGSTVYVKTLVQTQTRRQTMEEAPEQVCVVKGKNDQPFPPGYLHINGGEGGEITGPAILTWRARSGVGQEVVFYDDDISQASQATTYEITVLHGGQQVWQQNAVDGEIWEFTGERDANGGLLFDELTFVLRSTRHGFDISVPVEISVTRTSIV